MTIKFLARAVLLAVSGLALFVGSASANVFKASGSVQQGFSQTNLTEGAVEDDQTALLFTEKDDLTLGAPLPVDAAAPGRFGSDGSLPGGQIAAGTRVSSYLVHIDPRDTGVAKCFVVGIQFDSPILGIITRGSTLETTDGVLKHSPGSVFAPSASRGMDLQEPQEVVVWETTPPQPSGLPAEQFRFGGCSFDPVDELRIVTAFAPDCAGSKATVVDARRTGPGGVTGTNGADVIVALAGDDTIAAGGGADLVCGGADNDSLSGAAGKDRLLGEDGDDQLKGGSGKDKLVGGLGKDLLRAAGGGKDKVNCGPGQDKAIVDKGDAVGKSCEKVTGGR